ncbi:MAG: DNA polymerase III subunit gamma/tau [Rheinheimera sp.]|nr:DNA polymerase III subunit gamma/tau [Rheinheimera sp.]
MSYQVLARKWRPQNFGQLVGQEHVKAALTHALTQNRLHHAYLFTGTRGVGKTTIARIFAKSLNCEQGVTATPCGICSACTEIDKGFFVDLMEIDAASRTKVEDTRDLLDNVQYAPTRGRYKVYLIDEVHMLSKHSFNALLKTLEEPPPHVKFLLATTDPQKLPITVLSRCLQFSLKALSQSQIKQHLSYILGQEGIAAEDEALALLARAAKGSLRDSLSLTDQAIAQTNGDIRLGAVREMLGFLEQSWAEILLQDVLNRDLASMQAHIQQLVSSHSHFQAVLDDMLSLLHLAALSQYQLSASELALTESAFVRAVAKAHAPESIQLYYQLLLSGKRDLPYAPEPRIGLEMALLRAIAFVPAKAGAMPEVSAGRAAALSAAHVAPAQVSAVASPPAETQMPQIHIAQLQPEPALAPVEVSQAVAVAVTDAVAAPEPDSAIDSVTASILARRGLQRAASNEPKKSERQQAPVVLPARTPPVVAAPLSSAVSPEPVQSRVSVPETKATTTSLELPKVGDIPPWDELPASPTADNAADPEPLDDEVPVARPFVAPVATEDDVDPADRIDSVESAEQWQWQQTYTAATAQPIRHALLESLAVPDLPDNLDFASETIAEVQTISATDADLTFDGQIHAGNFAVRNSSQVDAWAQRIDSLRIGGLMRLFLLHSSMALQGDQLTLQVSSTQRHLDSERNRAQLQSVLAESFGLPLSVDIAFVDEVPASPQAIQQRIDAARRRYVHQVLQDDPTLKTITRDFAGEWLPDSLEVF